MSRPDDLSSAYTPEDLALAGKTVVNKGYLDLTFSSLIVNTKYNFQFSYVDLEGNESNPSPVFSVTTNGYVTKLVKPTITVTPSTLGYVVAYTKQTDSNFAYAVIEESISNSSTPPTTGWTEVIVTPSNPATVTVGTVDKRWVRIKLTDKISGITPYSDPVSVTPVDPVAAAIDSTPPNAATGINAAWSGDNILITATVAADAKKFIISLANGSTTGFFTKFPTGSGTSQTILITKQELYNTLGSHFTSFSGVFISADAFDNRDSGVNFTVAEKANPLLGVTPTFTLTGITNGYTATWVLPSGADYAKVYESGTSWGAGNPPETDLVFSGQSPAIIKKTVYTTRYVKIKYVTEDGFNSSWSSEQSVTPIDSISADTNAPDSPTPSTASNGIDSSGTVGFGGYIDLSWTAVSDSSLRGYRIRFRTGTNPYSYVDSPGTGTTYRLSGLAVGATYEIGIASYDEFNNTSSTYNSFTAQTISGTPFVGTNVNTTGYFSAGTSPNDFQFGYGIDSDNNSATFTGTKRGLYFTAGNYWVIDSSQSAKFKVGGASSNYVKWDGAELTIDGNLGVAGGTKIGGNIQMASGASIWSGPLNSGGNLVGDGFLLTSGGLSIKKGSINLRLDTSDGGIYAEYGQIAGWTIDSSKFERGTSGTYTGISSSGTYAIWAGSSTSAGDANAKFSVTPAGAVIAKDITITGGSLTVGASSIAASTGKLISTDAEITGKITANSGKIGNVNIDSGGLYISDAFPPSASSGNRIIFNSGGIAAYSSGSANPKFELASDGTAKIAGFTINATTLDGNGITIDSANQKIGFTSGFQIDNDNVTYSTQGTPTSSIAYYGGADGDGNTNYVDSSTVSGTPTTTSSYSSLTIKPAGTLQSSTTAIKMSTSGFAQMQAGGSYVGINSSGIVLNMATTGGLVLQNFTSAIHYTYNYKEAGATLQVFSDGRVTAGRSFYKSGATESSITSSNFSHVGLIGDIIFSTAD